jgi:peptidoglycan/LPS O-acetylase OafA/YrhL
MGTLRTLLALSVLIAHGSFLFIFVGAENAVQLFYVISGFLISFVLTDTSSYRHVGVFWLNRALRLYPIYFVVALFTLAARYVYPGHLAQFPQIPLLAQIYLVIINFTIIGQDWLMFMGVRHDTLQLTGHFQDSDFNLYEMLLVPQAWTIGVELSFYAVAPFIVRRPFVLLALFLASVTARGFSMYDGFGLEDPWTYRFFPFELALFIAGAASHQLLLPRAKKLVELLPQFHLERVVSASCVVVCLLYFLVPLTEWIKLPMLHILVFSSLPFLFIFQDKSPIDQWIGDLSYPLYIGHMLVILTIEYPVQKFGFIVPGSLLDGLIKVIGCLVFAVALKIFIADPVEKLRKIVRTGRRPLATTELEQSPAI